MFRFRPRLAASVLTAALALSLLLPAAALAHERRAVGKYDLVVGWSVEPAFVGEKNGLSLTVTDRETAQPVEGLEKTLKAQILFGGQQRQLELRPVFRQPGAYTADVAPTSEGDYRFHLAGTIGETTVDEVFDSADGKFNGVEPIAAIQFPAPPAESAANPALLAAEQQAAAAQAAAEASQTTGLIGIGVGAVGVLLAAAALARSGRRQADSTSSSRQQAASS